MSLRNCFIGVLISKFNLLCMICSIFITSLNPNQAEVATSTKSGSDRTGSRIGSRIGSQKQKSFKGKYRKQNQIVCKEK